MEGDWCGSCCSGEHAVFGRAGGRRLRTPTPTQPPICTAPVTTRQVNEMGLGAQFSYGFTVLLQSDIDRCLQNNTPV